MTYVVFQQYGWGMLSQIPRKRDFPFMVGMDLVIAMPISWLPLVSDYSRFAKDSKVKFLGDLDQLFYCLFLDVSYRPDGFPCHPIP